MAYKLNVKLITLIIGIIVSAIIAPKNEFFLPNFLYFWLPQGIIIGLLFVIKIDHRAIAGCAIIMTLHLIVYSLWISSPHNALAWLGYLFSIPGAFVGALLVGLYLRRNQIQSSKLVITSTAIGTFLGISIIQIGLCCTVLYCGIKC